MLFTSLFDRFTRKFSPHTQYKVEHLDAQQSMNIWYAVNLIDILLPSFVGFAYHENQILIALCTAVSRYVCVCVLFEKQ